MIDFTECLCEIVIAGFADPDFFVCGPVFWTAACVAGDELDKGFCQDLRRRVVPILAGLEDFVFVERAGGFVHGLFRSVVPTNIDPLFATICQ